MIGAAVIGAGASLYGANKQSQAIEDSNNSNSANVARTDQSAWNSYLMGRGLYGADAATGTIPNSATIVNTKLPLWANVTTTPQGGAVAKWVKKGTTPSPTQYKLTPNMPGSGPTTTSAGAGGGAYGPSLGYSQSNVFMRNEAQAMGEIPGVLQGDPSYSNIPVYNRG